MLRSNKRKAIFSKNVMYNLNTVITNILCFFSFFLSTVIQSNTRSMIQFFTYDVTKPNHIFWCFHLPHCIFIIDNATNSCTVEIIFIALLSIILMLLLSDKVQCCSLLQFRFFGLSRFGFFLADLAFVCDPDFRFLWFGVFSVCSRRLRAVCFSLLLWRFKQSTLQCYTKSFFIKLKNKKK